ARRLGFLLVTDQGTRRILPLEELRERLEGVAEVDTVIRILVEGRLLVAQKGQEGEWLELAHDSMAARFAARKDPEHARFLDRLDEAVGLWRERGRPRALLWT